MIAKAEEVKHELLSHPEVQAWLQSLWGELKRAMLAAADDPHSELRRRLTDGLTQRRRAPGRPTPSCRPRSTTGSSAPSPTSSTTTRARSPTSSPRPSSAGTAPTPSRRIELQVGRDLQFIRINGTVVGGLAGLAIHTVGETSRSELGSAQRPARRLTVRLRQRHPSRPSRRRPTGARRGRRRSSPRAVERRRGRADVRRHAAAARRRPRRHRRRHGQRRLHGLRPPRRRRPRRRPRRRASDSSAGSSTCRSTPTSPPRSPSFAATDEAAALTGERARLLAFTRRDIRLAGHELDARRPRRGARGDGPARRDRRALQPAHRRGRRRAARHRGRPRRPARRVPRRPRPRRRRPVPDHDGLPRRRSRSWRTPRGRERRHELLAGCSTTGPPTPTGRCSPRRSRCASGSPSCSASRRGPTTRWTRRWPTTPRRSTPSTPSSCRR